MHLTTGEKIWTRRLPFLSDSTHKASDLALVAEKDRRSITFYETELSLSAVQEMIRIHGENSLHQILKCARYYKERALADVYPNRASIRSLPSDKRKVIYQRAIALAEEDAVLKMSRP